MQCGFLKGFDAQRCSFVLVENYREALDKMGYPGILLTDFSKALIEKQLLIAKLHSYGFSLESLTLFFNDIDIDL